MKLYNADCLEVLKTMADETVDCVVTDCPYHIISGGCTKDAEKLGRYREAGGILRHRMELARDEEDETQINLSRQGKFFKHNDIKFTDWLPEVYRVMKQDTHCYVMINPRNLKDLQIAAEEAGFRFLNLIVWDKGNVTPNMWYMSAYELILVLRKGRAKKINNKGTKNLLTIPNIRGNKTHPTEKPVALMRVLVENSTQPGETVLDPFMGTGSTGIACEELGRDFIGIEIDSKYYDIAMKRIKVVGA